MQPPIAINVKRNWLLGFIGFSCACPQTAALRRLDVSEIVQVSPLPLRRPKYAHAQVARPGHVLMAWTPRAACSFAMEIWTLFLGCYDQASHYKKALGVPGSIHDFRNDVLNTMAVGAEAEAKDLSNPTMYTFKVTMNPYHRMVTMFDHAMQWNWTVFDKEVAKNPKAKLFVNEVRTITYTKFGVSDINDLSFFQFVQVMQWLPLHDVDRYPWGVHVHYGPQATEKEPMWDLICHVERIEKCLATVNRKTGLNFTVPPKDSAEASRHNTEHEVFGREVAQLPYRNLKKIRKGSMPMTEDFYMGAVGAEVANWVREGYMEDFTRFNYAAGLVPTSADLSNRWFLLN